MSFLESKEHSDTKSFELFDPDQDKEIRPQTETCTLKTLVSQTLGTSRFERFSTWSRLVAALSRLQQAAATYHHGNAKDSRTSVDFMRGAELLVLREVQQSAYAREITCIQSNSSLPKDSSLSALSPILGQDGLLRVGGRLRHSRLETGEKMPVIIPGKHHIATLLVRHHHGMIQHQGRHLTEGALRSAG